MLQIFWFEVPEWEEDRLDENSSLSVGSNHPLFQVGGPNVPHVVAESEQVDHGIVAGICPGKSVNISPFWQFVLSETLIVIPFLSQEVFGISSSFVLSINSKEIRY